MKTGRIWLILALLILTTTACRSVAAFGSAAAETEPAGVAATSATGKSVLSEAATEPTAAADAASPSALPPATSTALPTTSPTPAPSATPVPTEAPTAAATATAEPDAAPDATASPTPAPTATYPPPPAAVNVPILMYHYISELPADADVYRRDLTVTPARFEAHLQWLTQQGYRTVTLADVHARLTTGKPLPPKPIVLTFDDGYKDAYTQAFPLLQQYGFVGEFFVLATPAHYEAAQYLSWGEMREMAAGGMSIQAHGRDHFDLTGRDYDFLVYQILGAREAVEAHTERPVRFFCYPSGRHDGETEAVVASAGYLGAVTTAWGNELRLENAYTWPRIRIKGEWDLETFATILTALPASN